MPQTKIIHYNSLMLNLVYTAFPKLLTYGGNPGGAVVASLVLFASPAWASKQTTKVNLIGCRGHFAASGWARHVVTRNEQKTPDQEETVVHISNVPLPTGTNLFVYIADEAVGTIKLDKERGGSLKFTSGIRKFVPSIDYGTSIEVKTVDGRLVMW